MRATTCSAKRGLPGRPRHCGTRIDLDRMPSHEVTATEQLAASGIMFRMDGCALAIAGSAPAGGTSALTQIQIWVASHSFRDGTWGTSQRFLGERARHLEWKQHWYQAASK